MKMEVIVLSTSFALFACALWTFMSRLRNRNVQNCWFCCRDSHVSTNERNSWTCHFCDQYNGFLPDGDYNKVIPSQSDAALNNHRQFTQFRNFSPSNGLCVKCNRNQELKVSQLASFEPINPQRFDEEIEAFRYHLERAYELCPSCENTLKDALDRKKTLVLAMQLRSPGDKGNFEKYSGVLVSSRYPILFYTLTLVSSSLALLLALLTTWCVVLQFNGPLMFFKQHSSSPRSSLEDQKSFPAPSPSQFIFSNVTSWPLEFFGISATNYCVLAAGGLAAQLGLNMFLVYNRKVFLWLLELSLFCGSVFLAFQGPYRIAAQLLQMVIAWLVLVSCVVGSKQRTIRFSSVGKKISRQKPFKTLENRTEDFSLDKGSPSLACSSPTLTILPSVKPPPRPASVTSESRLAFTSQLQATIQDDTCSNGSVDSAFSNADSILDAADSNIQPLFKPSTAMDVEVNKLVARLNLGEAYTRTIPKKQDSDRGVYVSKKPVLRPPRLNHSLNESSWGGGGFWQDYNGQSAVRSNVIGDLNPPSRSSSQSSGFISNSSKCVDNRSISPHQECCRGVLEASYSTPQHASIWNRSSFPMSPLSPIGTPSLYSSPGSAVNTTQVVYSPYGFHQQPVSPIWSQAMFMTHPGSYHLSNSSPSTFGGSVQTAPSPNSTISDCSRSNTYEFDSDPHRSFPLRRHMESSFFESVWLSRKAIFYTALSYTCIGLLVWGLWKNSVVLDVIASVHSKYTG